MSALNTEPHGLKTSLDAQLGPVTDALVRHAEEHASQILDDATRRVTATLADARVRVAALVEAARAEGEASARSRAARTVADARRDAREKVLRARTDAYERVRSAARDQLSARASTPAAEEFNARVAHVVRHRLGPTTTVEIPASGLGVIATQGSRRLDFSGDALVERELAKMAPRIEGLWS